MTRRTWIVVVALVLFGVTLAIRALVGHPGDAVLALSTVPIAMIAFEFGWKGGLVATAMAFASVLGWGQITTLGYVTRGVTYLATALVVGTFADRLREVQAEATRHQRRAEELAHQQIEAQLAAIAERARIAREFHDVIAHSVSVMTVQAAAARRILDGDRDRAAEALEAIERTGREALTEMRRLLGVLRRDGEGGAEFVAPPGMGDLEALVSQMEAAGLEVNLRLEGTPTELPAGVDVSAYRITQEALTNVLKHVGSTSTDLLVRYTNREVELVVSSELGSRNPATPEGSGQGLIGMRERVAMLGGELSTGPSDNGRFRVHARLPIRGPL
jgi:signal transduction histidine kinase